MPRKKKTAAAASTPAAAKSQGPMTKAAFIRLHPTKKAAEVVELAKAEGIALSIPHVYVVRTKSNADAKKKSGGTPKGKPGPKVGAKSSAKKAAKSGSPKSHGGALHADYDYDKQVRDIIFHIGFNGLKTMIDKIHHEIAG